MLNQKFLDQIVESIRKGGIKNKLEQHKYNYWYKRSIPVRLNKKFRRALKFAKIAKDKQTFTLVEAFLTFSV